MQILNQIYKNNIVRYYEKNGKNKYDPKIEAVKYLELIGQNKIWLIFNTASKVWNFLDMHLVIQLLMIFRQISDL